MTLEQAKGRGEGRGEPLKEKAAAGFLSDPGWPAAAAAAVTPVDQQQQQPEPATTTVRLFSGRWTRWTRHPPATILGRIKS